MLKRLMASGLAWWWLPVLLVVIDRYSKWWVSEHLTLYVPMRITSMLNLTLAYNTGAAFSFLHSQSGWQNWLFGGLAAIISALVIAWLTRLPVRAYWMCAALCLILAGAIGNAWDRMLYGHVIDFIDFHIGAWHFAIFNIADSAICVGAGMLFLHWAREGIVSRYRERT